jgi:pimeloyl-ACP methyl ester carboxylesterase
MAVSRQLALAVAAVSIASVLTAVPSEAHAPAHHARRQAPLHWARCKSGELQAVGARCAALRVPLDYGDPSGRTITLALARVRHTVARKHYQGVMLTNPGGPGSPGRYLAGLGAYVPGNVGAAYDWVGIDPRGVGASRPALSCNDRYFRFDRPGYKPTSHAALANWQTRAQRYAHACAQHNGALLEHMTTADAARDLNSIRIALGVQRVSYYGYSYGTYLGQVYATLFPGHVRRMVLDSTVNPTRVWYDANLEQDRAFQRNTVIWFRWLARYNSVYRLGRTEHAVEHRWYHIRHRLTAHADHGIGPDEWTDIFLGAAYYQSSWIELGDLFARYVHHHAYRGLRNAFRVADGLGNDNEYAVYTAVECTDTAWPTSWQRWTSDNTRVNRKAPFETWANAWYNAPCVYWPAPAHQRVAITGKGAPRALLVDESGDGATPYRGSLEVRKLFRRSSLIALPGGTSHANSLYGDSCLDNRIAAYLRSGRLPMRKSGNRADATCRPLPRPQP